MIQLPAYFTGFSSKTDGSAGLRFATNEVTPADFAQFKEDLNEFGWIVFKPNDNRPPEAPTENAEEEGKTPSEILKGRMAAYFRERVNKENWDGFETWRRSELEKIGQRYLKFLD